MSPRQERFVDEYLIDLNASQAAVRAGYKGDPNTVGPRLLANVGVRSLIEKAKAKRIARTEITQDRVLQELARIAFFDPRRLLGPDGAPKPINELDDDTAAALAGMDITEEFDGSGEDRKFIGYTKKFKIADKNAALTNAMRHLGMFDDKLTVNMKQGRAKRMKQRVE